MVKKVIRQYSEAFRIQVVREYEAGESIFSLRRKYGIGGKHTVQDWVKKYGTEGLRRGLMVMQTAEERDQVKELQERNRQLEQLVAQLSLDKLMLESTVAAIPNLAVVERSARPVSSCCRVRAMFWSRLSAKNGY